MLFLLDDLDVEVDTVATEDVAPEQIHIAATLQPALEARAA